MKSFHQFINESQERAESLAYLIDTGLLDPTEGAREIYAIAPELLGIAEVDFEIDWDFAAQHDSDEAIELLKGHFADSAEAAPPDGSFVLLDSLDDSNQWSEDDFWEEEDEAGSREPIYGTVVYARLKVAFIKTVTLADLEQWAEDQIGRVLGLSEITIRREPSV